MPMNKQRKVLVGVLCAGVGSLAVDRLLLAPPDSASADVIRIDPGEEQTPGGSGLTGALLDAVAAEPSDESSQELPSFSALTARLNQLAAQTMPPPPQSSQPAQPSDPAQADAQRDVADPFAIPRDWQPKTIGGEVPPPQNDIAQSDQLFLKENKLVAVLSSGGEQRAVVGNKIYRIGDTLGDYRLVEVNSRLVVWESAEGGRAVIMRIEHR